MLRGLLVVGHDPGPSSRVVLGQLGFGEPEGKLLGGRVMGVTRVDQVATDADGVLATDRARVGILRVGGTYDAASLLDDVLALEAHGHDGNSAGDVLDETGIERSASCQASMQSVSLLFSW